MIDAPETPTPEEIDYTAEIQKRLGTWIRINDSIGTTYFMPLNMIENGRDPGVKGVMRDNMTGLTSLSVPPTVVSKWIDASRPRL